MNNQAFIDGQNLYLGTTRGEFPWKVDLFRFRRYLLEKYHVAKAYYFLGCVNEGEQDLYSRIQEAGFIIIFRKHNNEVISRKKGNVDTDIVFTIMKKLYLAEDFDKVFLTSGDGDYYRMVKFLCDINRFGKMLHPYRKSTSSLYRMIPARYRDYLDSEPIKNKIAYKKRDLLR